MLKELEQVDVETVAITVVHLCQFLLEVLEQLALP